MEVSDAQRRVTIARLIEARSKAPVVSPEGRYKDLDVSAGKPKTIYMKRIRPTVVNTKLDSLYKEEINNTPQDRVLEEFSFDVPLASDDSDVCIGYRMPLVECGRVACKDGPVGEREWYAHAVGWSHDSVLTFVLDRYDASTGPQVIHELPIRKQRVKKGEEGVAAGNKYIEQPKFSQQVVRRPLNQHHTTDMRLHRSSRNGSRDLMIQRWLPTRCTAELTALYSPPLPQVNRWHQYSKHTGTRMVRILWGYGCPAHFADILEAFASDPTDPCGVSQWLLEEMPHNAFCRVMFSAGEQQCAQQRQKLIEGGNTQGLDDLSKAFVLDFHTDTGLDPTCDCRDVFAYTLPPDLSIDHPNPFHLSFSDTVGYPLRLSERPRPGVRYRAALLPSDLISSQSPLAFRKQCTQDIKLP